MTRSIVRPVGVHVGEVLVDVALRVDDHGAAGGGVADHVAAERETGEAVWRKYMVRLVSV